MTNVKTVEAEEWASRLPELLEQAASVPLVISGNSMSPFLVHGRDTVYLSKITQPLKKGDMIFYRRDSGQYILHRIIRAEGEIYDLVGDAQQLIERGVRRDQVIAIVTAVRRKGKLLRPGSFWWEFFEKVWLNMVPQRGKLVAGYTALRRK